MTCHTVWKIRFGDDYDTFERDTDYFNPITARAKELEFYRLKAYDVLHLSSAEAGKVDVFLTTDRRLINTAGQSDTNIKIMNPLLWLTEVLYNDK